MLRQEVGQRLVDKSEGCVLRHPTRLKRLRAVGMPDAVQLLRAEQRAGGGGHVHAPGVAARAEVPVVGADGALSLNRTVAAEGDYLGAGHGEGGPAGRGGGGGAAHGTGSGAEAGAVARGSSCRTSWSTNSWWSKMGWMAPSAQLNSRAVWSGRPIWAEGSTCTPSTCSGGGGAGTAASTAAATRAGGETVTYS